MDYLVSLHFWVDLVGIFIKNHGVRAMCSGLAGLLSISQASGFHNRPQASNWEDSLVFYYVCNCYLLRFWKSVGRNKEKSASLTRKVFFFCFC
jgi:hypothetical protein